MRRSLRKWYEQFRASRKAEKAQDTIYWPDRREEPRASFWDRRHSRWRW